MQRDIRLTRRLVAAIAVTIGLTVPMAVAGGGQVAAGEASDRGQVGVGTIDWADCEDPFLASFGAQCGMLSVPLDWARPRGERIELAVSRVAAAPDVEYQGVMLVNPGGPGGSGLIYSVLQAFVPGGAGLGYDWIGFDPRGVGASEPALSCIPDYFAPVRPAYEPTSKQIVRSWLGRAKRYAAACSGAGDLLDHLTTRDNARDMDAIRHALGQKQLNFYGYSYGTYLGQVYATMFPHRVRRMVLDSNVDPRGVWYQSNLDQAPAFEIVFDEMMQWIASYDDVYGLGDTASEVEGRYYDSLRGLATSPRPGLGAAEWADAFLPGGYFDGAWPGIAEAFAAYVHDDDPAPMAALYLGGNDTTNDNQYAIYSATQCTDAPWPQRWSTWQRDNTKLAKSAPFLTWGNAWFNAPCLYWPAEPDRKAPTVDGRAAPPILLLGETLDAATPFSGSLQVRKLFPRSSLIATVGGTIHANSLFGNACVDDQVAAYLDDGTLPRRKHGKGPDATCAPLPHPEPIVAEVATARVAADTDVLSLLRPALHR